MIWLVGNKGMLGAEVEESLRVRGHDYAASDREVDITDRMAPVQFLHSLGTQHLQWIVNCAAYTAVDKAEEEPDSAFAINETGVSNLCLAAQATGAALLHISTDYVFDGNKQGEYTEEDAPNPIGVYAQSKYKGELAVRNSLDRYIIVRTAWLFGRHGRNFVTSMANRFRTPGRVRVVKDQWGNPTYAKDLAGVILDIIERKEVPNGVYHFTNEGRTNWFEFAKEIYAQATACGMASTDVEVVPIATSEYPTKARRPQNSVLSKQKIKRTFGIMTRDWRDALRSYFEEEVA